MNFTAYAVHYGNILILKKIVPFSVQKVACKSTEIWHTLDGFNMNFLEGTTNRVPNSLKKISGGQMFPLTIERNIKLYNVK